jgi:hypothetical protein
MVVIFEIFNRHIPLSYILERFSQTTFFFGREIWSTIGRRIHTSLVFPYFIFVFDVTQIACSTVGQQIKQSNKKVNTEVKLFYILFLVFYWK